jgi:hypothetical protein
MSPIRSNWTISMVGCRLTPETYRKSEHSATSTTTYPPPVRSYLSASLRLSSGPALHGRRVASSGEAGGIVDIAFLSVERASHLTPRTTTIFQGAPCRPFLLRCDIVSSVKFGYLKRSGYQCLVYDVLEFFPIGQCIQYRC